MTRLFSPGKMITAVLQKGIGLLEEKMYESIIDFVLSRQNRNGGFRGRSPESDLYYTYFGCELLKVFDRKQNLLKADEYLSGQMVPEELDFVHLVCLVRSLFLVSQKGLDRRRKKMFSSLIGKYKAQQGGFNRQAGSKEASLYDTFLFLTVAEALEGGLFAVPAILGSVSALVSGRMTQLDKPTPVISALVSILEAIKSPGARQAAASLFERMDKSGGFYAASGAPVPDLLATGTALFALKNSGFITFETAEVSLDFIESCSHEEGGFFANFLDPEPDVEYTFYGLLALGSLVP